MVGDVSDLGDGVTTDVDDAALHCSLITLPTPNTVT